jgi:hypothetical protein
MKSTPWASSVRRWEQHLALVPTAGNAGLELVQPVA